MSPKKTRHRTRPEPKARVRRRVRPDAPADEPSEGEPNSQVQQEASDNQKVGYGKPPKKTQFKPGQSGNPKGRPKKSKNFKSYLREGLSQPVKIRGRDGEQHVPALKALALREVDDALKGNQRSTDRVLRNSEDPVQTLDQDSEYQTSADITDERDKAIVDEFIGMVRSGMFDEPIDDIDTDYYNQE